MGESLLQILWKEEKKMKLSKEQIEQARSVVEEDIKTIKREMIMRGCSGHHFLDLQIDVDHNETILTALNIAENHIICDTKISQSEIKQGTERWH